MYFITFKENLLVLIHEVIITVVFFDFYRQNRGIFLKKGFTSKTFIWYSVISL